MANSAVTNPTEIVDLDFGRYLEQRKGQLSAHTAEGGISDYSFALDHKLRQQIAAVGAVREIAQALVASIVPIQKQIQLMEGIAVGPRQFPEIHALGEDCARRLGIGIPQIFIYYSSSLGAYTIATDDVAPMIVLSSELVEAMEPQELKFVIGHECGHIHNLHGVYITAVEMMVNPLAQYMFKQMVEIGTALSLVKSIGYVDLVAGAIQGSLKLFFMRWSRCAEVTCDRAGLICCGNLETAQMALVKLVTGGSDRLKNINIQEYVRQIDQIQSSPQRFRELLNTHPLIPKRIQALQLFTECEILHLWRPDLDLSKPTRSKAETDALCEQLIGVLTTG